MSPFAYCGGGGGASLDYSSTLKNWEAPRENLAFLEHVEGTAAPPCRFYAEGVVMPPRSRGPLESPGVALRSRIPAQLLRTSGWPSPGLTNLGWGVKGPDANAG